MLTTIIYGLFDENSIIRYVGKTKEKIRIANIGKKHPHSEESKEKIRIARLATIRKKINWYWNFSRLSGIV